MGNVVLLVGGNKTSHTWIVGIDTTDKGREIPGEISEATSHYAPVHMPPLNPVTELGIGGRLSD